MGQKLTSRRQDSTSALPLEQGRHWSVAPAPDRHGQRPRARVQGSPIDGGIKFAVDGDGGMKQLIQRIVMAHAGIMNGVGGWSDRGRE